MRRRGVVAATRRRQPPAVGGAQPVEPRLDLGLAVAPRERVDVRGPARGLPGARGLAFDALGDARGESCARERALRRRAALDRLAELVGAPLHGGRRVVELVGDACGERAELGHLLALAEHALRGGPAAEDGVEERARRGEARAQQSVELLLRDGNQRGVGARVDGRHARVALEQRHLADDVAHAQDVEQHLARAGGLDDLHRALRDDVRAVAGAALGEELLARRDLHILRLLAQPLEVGLRQLAEERHALECLVLLAHAPPLKV